jgi:hypothetical protein
MQTLWELKRDWDSQWDEWKEYTFGSLFDDDMPKPKFPYREGVDIKIGDIVDVAIDHDD